MAGGRARARTGVDVAICALIEGGVASGVCTYKSVCGSEGGFRRNRLRFEGKGKQTKKIKAHKIDILIELVVEHGL